MGWPYEWPDGLRPNKSGKKRGDSVSSAFNNHNNKFRKHEARKLDFGVGFSGPLIIDHVCSSLYGINKNGEKRRIHAVGRASTTEMICELQMRLYESLKAKGSESKRLKVLHIVRGGGRVVAS